MIKTPFSPERVRKSQKIFDRPFASLSEWSMDLAKFVLDISKYRTVEALGEGTFGRVVKACHETSGEIVAIKYIKNPLQAGVGPQAAFINELDILATNEHPSCLRLKGFQFSHRV
jgi:serine/threonine protein kinase